MDFPAWDPVLLGYPVPADRHSVVRDDVRRRLPLRAVDLCPAGASASFFPVAPESTLPDLIFYCVFGVMLGGQDRLRAVLRPVDLLNPLEFLQVWKGGLAFHGGLAGVCIAMWMFCRRHKIGWARTADAAALGVCPGIFAVRFANFINGELYGRITSRGHLGRHAVPDGSGGATRNGADGAGAERCATASSASRLPTASSSLPTFKRPAVSQVDDLGRPINWDRIEPLPRLGEGRAPRWGMTVDGVAQHVVPYRHPSQLYEGICEGLLVGLVLWILYSLTRSKPMRTGRYAAIFLLGYAVARFCLEFVRKPDEQFYEGDSSDGTVLFGMTMGQTLTLGMVDGGADDPVLAAQARDGEAGTGAERRWGSGRGGGGGIRSRQGSAGSGPAGRRRNLRWRASCTISRRHGSASGLWLRPRSAGIMAPVAASLPGPRGTPNSMLRNRLLLLLALLLPAVACDNVGRAFDRNVDPTTPGDETGESEIQVVPIGGDARDGRPLVREVYPTGLGLADDGADRDRVQREHQRGLRPADVGQRRRRPYRRAGAGHRRSCCRPSTTSSPTASCW